MDPDFQQPSLLREVPSVTTDTRTALEVGAKLQAANIHGQPPHAGCGYYEHAVCVSVEPLVLVSWNAVERYSQTGILPQRGVRGGVRDTSMQQAPFGLNENCVFQDDAQRIDAVLKSIA